MRVWKYATIISALNRIEGQMVGNRNSPQNIDQHIGSRLSKRRRALGISRVTLSKKTSIPVNELKGYENGAAQCIACGPNSGRHKIWCKSYAKAHDSQQLSGDDGVFQVTFPNRPLDQCVTDCPDHTAALST